MSQWLFPAAAAAAGGITLSHPATKTSTVTGTGVDISAYSGPLLVVQDVGTVSGTLPTLDGKIQDSPNNSDWTDVSGATFTQVTASNSLQSIVVQCNAVAQYIRYIGTVGGSNPSYPLAVSAHGFKSTNT
jgi:hypothetical protein